MSTIVYLLSVQLISQIPCVVKCLLDDGKHLKIFVDGSNLQYKKKRCSQGRINYHNRYQTLGMIQVSPTISRISLSFDNCMDVFCRHAL